MPPWPPATAPGGWLLVDPAPLYACCVLSAAKQGAERKIRTLDAAIDEDPKVEGGAFADDPGNQPRFGAGTGEADMQHIGQDAVDRLDTLPRIVEPMPQRGRQVCGGHDLGVIPLAPGPI